MNPNSRQIIHMGINFTLSPMPIINVHSNLEFQKSLATWGIDFSKVEFKEREVLVVREVPTRLEVKVAAIQPPAIGQLLILAPHSGSDLTLFGREAEAIVKAYASTWPTEKRQIISCDATLRDLYAASGDHAFRELWEIRFGQSLDALSVFGRPVLGGGLRLVMSPQPDDLQPVQIEVKIESFLRDATKLFVETQFKWPRPMPPGASLDPMSRLNRVDEFVEEKVVPFMMGGIDIRPA